MRAPIAIAASVSAIVAMVFTTTPASGLATDFGIDIYLSAPKVQGTAVTTGVSSENFNSATLGTCPTTIQIGDVTGDCNVETAGDYGGASADADDPTPTTSGSGSQYVSTSDPTREVTIDLTEPARYLGLWWSAGSPTNDVELYMGDELVASMATATIITLLQGSTVTSIGAGNYNSSDYFGNPRNTSLASGEPFIFLNLYSTGGATFDRVVLSGQGFEFDNISVSDLAQTPASSEVPLEFIPGENAPAPAPAPTALPETGVNDVTLMTAGLLGALTLAAGISLVTVRRRATN